MIRRPISTCATDAGQMGLGIERSRSGGGKTTLTSRRKNRVKKIGSFLHEPGIFNFDDLN